MTSVGVGVLTYNHIETGRQQDFETTWETIQDAGHDAEFLLLTNGSTDGTQDRVKELGGIVDDSNRAIWYGNQRLVDELGHNDIVVLSADDLAYQSGWLGQVVAFLEEAPDALAILSAYMEPVWDWNLPRAKLECGGVSGVVRDSVCGSSWIFRSEDWKGWMGPFPRIFPGEDLVVCNRVRDRGRLMAALDLVEHIGEERSAWGNKSHQYAIPFDREAWGL